MGFIGVLLIFGCALIFALSLPKPKPGPRQLEGRAVDFFEEEHGSDTFTVLQVSDPELPSALCVEAVPKPGVLDWLWSGPPPQPALPTGDRPFDDRVRVSGLTRIEVATLFDDGNRRRVSDAVASGATLSDGRWRLSRQRAKDAEQFAEPLAAVSKQLAGAWSRVAQDRHAVMLEHLVSDPVPERRSIFLAELLAGTEDVRQQALAIARTHDDINIRAQIAAQEGSDGVPVLLEAAEGVYGVLSQTRIEALRVLGRHADDATRAALVRGILLAGPTMASAAVLEAALDIVADPTVLGADAFAPWLSPDHGNGLQRAHVVRWIARLGDAGRTHALQVLAAEKTPLVLQAAAETLALVGVPADVRHLRARRPGRLSAAPNSRDVRVAIDRAIDAIQQRAGGEPGELSLTDVSDGADGRLTLDEPAPLAIAEDDARRRARPGDSERCAARHRRGRRIG